MAKNTFHLLSDTELVAFMTNAGAAFTAGPATAYGLTAGTLTAVTDATTALQTAINEAATAEAAFHAAITNKEIKRADALSAISTAANIMYAYPAITPVLIEEAGFQNRDTSKTPVLPVQPIDLVATPAWDGTVNVKWNRNGNPYSVSFVVESSADGVSWSTAAYTGKRTATLEGFAPGVKTYFRVRATHRDVASLPSNTFAIYDSGETVELQIAA